MAFNFLDTAHDCRFFDFGLDTIFNYGTSKMVSSPKKVSRALVVETVTGRTHAGRDVDSVSVRGVVDLNAGQSVRGGAISWLGCPIDCPVNLTCLA